MYTCVRGMCVVCVCTVLVSKYTLVVMQGCLELTLGESGGRRVNSPVCVSQWYLLSANIHGCSKVITLTYMYIYMDVQRLSL